MIKRLAVVVACLTLSACPATTSMLPAAKSATPLNCDGTGVCVVNVIDPTCTTNPCSASVDVDPVTFKRGKHNIPVFWKLPEGFGFCGTNGDGVFLKDVDPNQQFRDQGPDGPEGPGVCKHRQFKLTAKNTVSGLRFPYKIVFHNEAGTRQYIVDPSMVNE